LQNKRVTLTTYQEKLNLFKSLFTGNPIHSRPFTAEIDLTRQCNLTCFGCKFHSRLLSTSLKHNSLQERNISLSLFKKACNELKSMGTKQIVLTGEGEPFLHPKLFDIISLAKKAVQKVILYTNGTFLDKERIQSLIDSGLDILRVSLWAGSAKNYEDTHPGISGSKFDEIINGLKLLEQYKYEQKKRSPSVVLFHALSSYNFKNIESMVDIAKEVNCKGVTFFPLQNRRGELDSFSLSQEEEKMLRISLITAKRDFDSHLIDHNIDEVLSLYNKGKNAWHKSACYIAWYHTYIKIDGTVVPCFRCDIPMGNLNKSGFEEIWKGNAYNAFRQNTIMGKGLRSVEKNCDCSFCCHHFENLRVNRIFKWFSPFRLRKT